MEQRKNSFLQQRLADEAVALLSIAEQDANMSEYQQAIRLVGKGQGASQTVTDAQLQRIEAARDEIVRKCAGEIINDPIITDEIIANWPAMKIHETVMALFEASLYLEQQEERCALFNMANQILDTQSFEDWILNLADSGSQAVEPHDDNTDG